MEFLEIGKIVKPHGLKGRMKVLSYVTSDGLLTAIDHIYIRRSEDNWERFMLKSLQMKGPCFYLELAGVESIEKVQELVGQTIFAAAEDWAPLPEGEFYWQELIGLQVLTEEGNALGRLQRIFPTGSNDVFVCGEGKDEIFLPAIEEVVRKIDVERGTVTVRLLEGL